MYPVDLLNRKHEQFVLWAPGSNAVAESQPPKLVLGTIGPEGKPFNELTRLPLAKAAGKTDLWELDPKTITPSLADGVYHYWFEIQDTSPEQLGTLLVTDPLAFTVDYRLGQGEGEQLQPATVIKYRDGKLWPCDIDGTEPSRPAIPDQASLPSNNHLVIYELPTSWATVGSDERGVHVDVGTFADVKSLFDDSKSSKFGYGGILADLGINALELLPVADAKTKDEWGYATANYFAPDSDLGSASELVALVETIQGKNIRLITDLVMAFGHDSYGYIAFKQFHLRPTDEPDNPESYQSHAPGVLRDGFGGQSWRYGQSMETYDPESGEDGTVFPAWLFHRAHLARWMADFMVGGLRLDSVNNVGSWDFLRAYKERAWELYNNRYGGTADPSKFLVIAEELTMPISMVQSGVVNALWNEPWQRRLRAVLLGEPSEGDEFEWTVRKVADCRLDNLDGSNFTDGAQAINYITSHDIEGYRKGRLYDFLQENSIWDVEKRAKLAFALLLTSVGIPMIFAGEEFADQMDSSTDMAKKQSDPVNYSRKDDGGWRQSLFGYVSNLVKFRTKCPALGEDDTDFFHVDQSQGGKIMAWSRGQVGEGTEPVVIVANFTDQDTAGEQYVIPNWPDADKEGWREVSQARDVPGEWVGKEPLMAWEAKIYTRWRE
jgi:pullulanase